MIMDENKADLSSFSRGASTGGPPPVGIQTTPRQVIFDDIGMRIDHNGVWHYQGSSINRLELVKLFASVLRCDDNGAHWLITPAEIAPVTVEDAPFMIVAMSHEGEGHNQVIRLRTNINVSVTVDTNHPLCLRESVTTGELIPYLTLDGGLQAKLNRPTYYDVMALGVEENLEQAHIFGIWSDGVFHPLGDAGDN
jgi:uncharacterized protein